MIPRLTIITAFLGALVLLLSQIVFAYSLNDQFGFAITRLSLLSKHGPAVAIMAAVAGLATVYLRIVVARNPDATMPAARFAGIVNAGMGFAAMLVFFLIDLPDVGSTGMFDAPRVGNIDTVGVATGGLWMELVGGLILLFTGIALFVVGSRRSESALAPED